MRISTKCVISPSRRNSRRFAARGIRHRLEYCFVKRRNKLDTGDRKKDLYLFDLLPRTAGDAEVAVGGRFAEDGATEAEAFNNSARTEIEILCDYLRAIFSLFVQ